MWEPLLEREIKSGSSLGWWQGTGPRTVFCVCAPPRHSMTAQDYKAAQDSVATIVRTIQEYRTAPLPVGLQDDFWTVARSELGPGFEGSVPDGYLEAGGAGIVAAIAETTKRPVILRLERDGVVESRAQLERAATSFMTDSAPFFRVVIAAYRDLRSRVCSPRLRELQDTLEDHGAGGGHNGRVRRLARLARSLAIDLDTPSYRPIAIYERLLDLETRFDEAGINRERRALEQEIRARVQPQAIDPRAAVELKLYELLDRREHDETYQARIAELRGLLTTANLPAVPDKLLKDVAYNVEFDSSDYLTSSIRIRPEEHQRPHQGTGDAVSRLIELGTLLKVDLASYQQLKHYVYYSNLHRRLLELSGYTIGSVVGEALDKLTNALMQRLASPEEARLLEHERAVEFLEDLGRFVLTYDSGLRKVLLRFDLEGFCRLLVTMGATLPEGWQRTAAELGSRLTTARALHDRAVRRAKDLASALVAAMDERGDDAAILYCDGYLHGILATWFRGRDVSHSLLRPSWNT